MHHILSYSPSKVLHVHHQPFHKRDLVLKRQDGQGFGVWKAKASELAKQRKKHGTTRDARMTTVFSLQDQVRRVVSVAKCHALLILVVLNMPAPWAQTLRVALGSQVWRSGRLVLKADELGGRSSANKSPCGFEPSSEFTHQVNWVTQLFQPLPILVRLFNDVRMRWIACNPARLNSSSTNSESSQPCKEDCMKTAPLSETRRTVAGHGHARSGFDSSNSNYHIRCFAAPEPPPLSGQAPTTGKGRLLESSKESC